jgi:hypothetical protein
MGPEREEQMFTLGKREGRREVLEELRRLLGLDVCPHCQHTEREDGA